MKIKVLKIAFFLILITILKFSFIIVYACILDGREGFFTQSMYEKGEITPEEAICWSTYTEESFNWKIDYWHRFDNLKRIDIGYHTFTYENLQQFFELGNFPSLKYLNISNYCSGRIGEFPAVVFENKNIIRFTISDSYFKYLPDAFYEYGDSLYEINFENCPEFKGFDTSKIIKLTNISNIFLFNVNIEIVPKGIQDLKMLEWFHVYNTHILPIIPDMSFSNIRKLRRALQFEVFWDYKLGCLDTMPVIVKQGTDSIIESFGITCFKHLPLNKVYLQSFSNNRPSIGYIDVTNQNQLPNNVEYLGLRRDFRIINPHRLKSLKPLQKMDIENLYFYMPSGYIHIEDFEILVKELTQLKHLKRVSFEKGVPHNISNNTKKFISQLDFLESLYFEDKRAGEEFEKYLPRIIRYRK